MLALQVKGSPLHCSYVGGCPNMAICAPDLLFIAKHYQDSPIVRFLRPEEKVQPLQSRLMLTEIHSEVPAFSTVTGSWTKTPLLLQPKRFQLQKLSEILTFLWLFPRGKKFGSIRTKCDVFPFFLPYEKLKNQFALKHSLLLQSAPSTS